MDVFMTSSKYVWNTWMLLSSFTLISSCLVEHYSAQAPSRLSYLQTNGVRVVSGHGVACHRENVGNGALEQDTRSILRQKEDIPSGEFDNGADPGKGLRLRCEGRNAANLRAFCIQRQQHFTLGGRCHFTKQ